MPTASPEYLASYDNLPDPLLPESGYYLPGESGHLLPELLDCSSHGVAQEAHIVGRCAQALVTVFSRYFPMEQGAS